VNPGVAQLANSLYQGAEPHNASTEAESVVFIVDDDASVRRSIQDLLSSVALRSEAFATIKTHQRTGTP